MAVHIRLAPIDVLLVFSIISLSLSCPNEVERLWKLPSIVADYFLVHCGGEFLLSHARAQGLPTDH